VVGVTRVVDASVRSVMLFATVRISGQVGTSMMLPSLPDGDGASLSAGWELHERSEC